MDNTVIILHIQLILKYSVPAIPFPSLTLVDAPCIFLSERNWHWETIIQNYYNLWIALDGLGSMVCDGKTYPIRPGTAFVFFPGQRVLATHDPKRPVRNFACHFHPESAKGTPKSLPGPLQGIQIIEQMRAEELCRAAVHCSRHPDPLGHQQCAGLCYQILAQVWRDAHTPPMRETDAVLLNLIDRLNEQPSRRWSTEQMARKAGLSTAQFNRRFIALAGQPPAKLAIRQRIRRAGELLRDSSLRIGEIAEALGYRDIYYFSRQFKQVNGITPTEYRDQLPF